MREEKKYSIEWLGRTLTIKIGKLAKQANAALTVQYGDTVVLATVVESKIERESIDYFPLMVDFEEKFYAAGIIKGSRWVKREGRPSDEAVLAGRMIDRSIRPLFNEESRKDVQVMLTILSVDQENDHDVVSLVAASAALALSGLNWAGPIGGIRVGLVNDKFIFNPTYKERAESSLDLIVVATAEKVIMIEAGANEVKEDIIYTAIKAGRKEQAVIIDLIKKIQAEIKINKKEKKEKLISPAEEAEVKAKDKITNMADEWLAKNVKNILFDKIYYSKGERKAAVSAIKNGLDKYLFTQGASKDERAQAIAILVEKAVETAVTDEILKNKKRVDGRKLNEIRGLSAEIGLLPRTHGSSLFSRGETQIMSIVTLGSSGMEQTLEGIEGVSSKRYMHHYNFPPFSVGEAKPLRTTDRREIGHGALAEKAILPLIPSKENFPYTIRVVSETLGSNGSSSMGSACASSLALMDAGVPIKKAIAGIAMGLASSEDMSQWEILTDIQDLEDGQGGMDFKIAGTADGVTAIQMDTKTLGLTDEIIDITLKRGYEARLEILKVMNKAINESRKELSPYAPKIESFHINPEKIRDIIGPGGKVINKIIADYGVEIDVEDDGLVMVCGTDKENLKKASDLIKLIARELKVGEIFLNAKVVRIMDFGAFIELTPNQDGMVHVSQLAPYRVEKVSDFVKEGDLVNVKIKEIDDKSRINLTMLGLPENEHLWQEEKGKSNGFGQLRFNNNRNRFNNNNRRNHQNRY
ncbi:polyribonucleotide nucleotidyltransferase [Candidatus Falkowbacteria bacterium CG_4_10_14_0_2_um_filter_36_22]|uniref:Polyribonucleotide nucleotidyltransferase n=1 Tax=Candidatus Falkowbacteria bacterium CG02_land_8_20_14_3_00_36_14 TaxID=1974560 RepID=A0A2M7DQ91_9BACT|nr:MAG: polyribonucleotide nucleotidyltransferase [Candidatus Falkowbacteria bacterium CG02_land_8_20_14_3_00_36_14]PIX11365.1 MAG: polyribonucleotide nucleotidyltransferase [Candidatus Falkowbacteria bacterium CG_4_8_14_3_um_filter_36_11]PJA10818.1 MAG: polyribonucleotide nucleotidyltransferase [Candidatus Falkowbacteria bacterium CG_4_10_14_0_2_um_filter_36_22]